MASTNTWGMVAVAALTGYAAFELALAAGAPWGRLAWGGQSAVLPAGLRIASGIAAVVYAGLAVVVARRVGFLGRPLDGGWTRALLYVVAVFMALGVPLNLASRSAPERFQSIGAGVVAISCFFVARAASAAAATGAAG